MVGGERYQVWALDAVGELEGIPAKAMRSRAAAIWPLANLGDVAAQLGIVWPRCPRSYTVGPVADEAALAVQVARLAKLGMGQGVELTHAGMRAVQVATGYGEWLAMERAKERSG